MVLIDRNGGIETVRFNTDRIDALNAEVIKADITRLFEIPHTKILIDFTGVMYLDSSGFSMLLYLLRTARASYCTMKLCSLSQPVKGLFNTLNLDSTFDICPDIRGCLESFTRGGPA